NSNIAVADHGNFHGILHCRDPLPARVAAITLLTSSSVQRDSAQPTILGHLRQFDTYNLFVVPSDAELHRKRNLHRRAYRFKNRPDARQIAKQSRPAIALHYFLRWTSEVQIDKIETEVFHDACGVCHHLRIAAEKLRGDRMLIFVEMQVALGFLVFRAKYAVRRGELGHNQPAAAKIADESPENGVGHARHRREDCGRRNIYGPDPNGARHRGVGGRDTHFPKGTPAIRRVVPKLLHSSILPARSFWAGLAGYSIRRLSSIL